MRQNTNEKKDFSYITTPIILNDSILERHCNFLLFSKENTFLVQTKNYIMFYVFVLRFEFLIIFLNF